MGLPPLRVHGYLQLVVRKAPWGIRACQIRGPSILTLSPESDQGLPMADCFWVIPHGGGVRGRSTSARPAPYES